MTSGVSQELITSIFARIVVPDDLFHPNPKLRAQARKVAFFLLRVSEALPSLTHGKVLTKKNG